MKFESAVPKETKISFSIGVAIAVIIVIVMLA